MSEEKQEGSWELARTDGKIGTGNWEAWGTDISSIKEAAEDWKKALEGIEKPWLCWALDDNWNILQQQLVKEAGWTPIVGNDTGLKKPTILPGSVYVNFNERLQLPTMWMHFPIEFAFLFCEKLAFWHSDLLCSRSDMKQYAKTFEALKPGEMAAVKHTHGWWGLKDRFRNHFGELVACTTKEASLDQFNNGCGWWRHIEHHPNFDKAFHKGAKYYYEHGTGTWVWNKKFKGVVKTLKVNEKDGHASARVNNKPERATKAEELNEYSDLADITKALKIDDLLPMVKQ
ncbi:hypothetical protein J1N51_10240 [Psychrosphaera ytuae]|uniref:Uncharacterized protein n=1 Tax=Psychrosphaera ytuae TaxID=2820710 RepID=A0A975D9Q1_9GAMM|nr:hypothetical protein [Psychrosphaera ytuae]QTH63122.1 hypothetical protein J1N51_10240 [Psychrosphaera ytuae]